MKIENEFILTCQKNSDWKTQKKLSHLLYQLKGYKTGERWGMNFTYVLNQDDELYEKVVGFYKENKESVEFYKSLYSVKLTKRDYEKAIAFIPVYPDYYCEIYEDIPYEYEECKMCLCKEKVKDNFYIQPKGYIKRHCNDYGMAGIDTAGGGILLLPKLVEKLINEGIDEKFFKPILSKSKKIMGYTYFTRNILPENVFCDRNYKFVRKCPLCGAAKFEEKENSFFLEVKYLKKEALQYLEDVNYTAEFYDGYREIIVSKRVAGIVSKYVENAEFIPVFLKE